MALEGLGNVKGPGAERPVESGKASGAKARGGSNSRTESAATSGGDRVDAHVTPKIEGHVDTVQKDIDRRAESARKERDLLLALANQPAAVRKAAQQLLRLVQTD